MNGNPLIIVSKIDGEIEDNALQSRYGKLITKLLPSAEIEEYTLISFTTKSKAKNYFSEHDPPILIVFGATACSESDIKGYSKNKLKGVCEIEHKGLLLSSVVRPAVLLPKLEEIVPELASSFDPKTKKFKKGSLVHNVYTNILEAKKFLDFINNFNTIQ